MALKPKEEIGAEVHKVDQFFYTFAQDKKPGDVTGDGKNGVWHVVKEH